MEKKTITHKVSKEESLVIMMNHLKEYKQEKIFYEGPLVGLVDKESNTTFWTSDTSIIGKHDGEIVVEVSYDDPEENLVLPCYLTLEEMRIVSVLLGRDIGKISLEKNVDSVK